MKKSRWQEEFRRILSWLLGYGYTLEDEAPRGGRHNISSQGHEKSEWKLDDRLLRIDLPTGQSDGWTLRNAVQGVQVFGGIGSGKSSGSGQTLAKTYLREGYGGIVLTAKINEATEWLNYARETDRWEHIVVFGEKNKFEIWAEYLEKENHLGELEDFKNKNSWEKGNLLRFNPLQYARGQGADTFTLTNLVMSLYAMGKNFSSDGSSSGGERYWDDQLQLYISRSIELLRLAGKTISLTNMREIMTSAPSAEDAKEYQSFSTILEEDVNEFEEGDKDKIEQYNQAEKGLGRMIKNSYCLTCVLDAGGKDDMSEDDQYIFNLVESYFLKEFATLSEKTRSIVETSFYGMIEPFMGGILRRYFMDETVSDAIKPEQSMDGKIIIINFPVKEHLISGMYAQAVYKKLWQEAVERRPVAKDGTTRPVFLWVDEAQYFLGKDDAKFQTTARSSMACTVFITQNISNYYAAIGGKYPKETTNSLLGVLGTKIFHANNDYVTNEWAANTIGKDFRLQQSISSSMAQMSGSVTESQALYYQVQPTEFTMLRSGGDIHNKLVDGIITVAGKKWKHGRNFVRATFTQNFDKI